MKKYKFNLVGEGEFSEIDFDLYDEDANTFKIKQLKEI